MKLSEIVLFPTLEDAFHGSPHMFAPDPSNKYGKFKTSEIGTGEGAQMFGHGLYFASSKAVANWYRRALSDVHWKYKNKRIVGATLIDAMTDDSPAQYVLGLLNDNITKVTKTHINKALANIDMYITKIGGDIERNKIRLTGNSSRMLMKFIQDDTNKINQLTAFRKQVEQIDPVDFKYVGGHLYHVSIPDDDEYMLWGNRVSDQPTNIRSILLNMPELQAEVDMQNSKLDRMNNLDPTKLSHPRGGSNTIKVKKIEDMTGQDVYDILTKKMNAPHASQYLLDRGIAGIKYMSGTISGTAGTGGYNYVVFDDSRIHIKKRE
jgi:hypothetical protein